MKRATIIFGSVVGVVAVLVVVGFRYFMGPPREAKLLDNFYAHRAAFEQLRDMIRNDPDVYSVADWGVATKADPAATHKTGPGSFPKDRYQKYLALLKETHSQIVQQSPAPDHEIAVGVWSAGFAGDTVHIDICWRDEPPSRQVSSFDSYYRDHKSSAGIGHGGRTGRVYRHIDSNWYLSTDL